MVFLDASAIIYLLEGDRTVQKATQKVLARLSDDQAEPALAISALSLMKCRVHPMRNNDHQRLKRFDNFFSDPGLITIDLTRTIVDQATQLRAQHGLRNPDALQAASCLAISPVTPFVTGDTDFQKLNKLRLHLIQ